MYKVDYSEESQPGLIAIARALASLRHPGRSVSGKLMLVVMLTTAIALGIAGAGLLVTDLHESRRAWADDLATEGRILSLLTAPALSFDDRSSASRSLAALEARASIRGAALYDADGALVAQYIARGDAAARARAPSLSPGVHVLDSQVELIQPISQNGEVLGTLYLRARYDVAGRMWAYAGVLAIVFIFSLAVALVLCAWLQHVITKPMESMTRVARGIVGRRDYTLRAAKTTGDEIGLVVDAFNKMLDEVQSRTRALEESEKLYRAIGESIEYGVWLCDATGRNTYASESFLRLAGVSQEECSASGWTRLLHPADSQATIEAWEECVRSGSNWYREHRILGADGEYHPILAQGVAIRDDDGTTRGWAGINLDINRLKLTEQALRDADRRKDEFLATLAHELRNPLAPIRNAVQLLDLPTLDERQRRWGREVIARQVGHMALLLDDLLDVSRITRGQLGLKREFVALQSIVEIAVETARPLIEAKRHFLNVTLPAHAVMLEADPLRLSQILANLLTNAAKYTDQGGAITLSASLNDSGLTLSVSDNGIGLKPESIPGLFTMFSQVDSAIDRAEGGLGIGLALVKGLVGLHGGQIEARSDGLGRGSMFIVSLPPSVIVTRSADAVAVESSQKESRAHARLLISDDNQDGAESLAILLRLSGYEVITTFTGTDALEAVRRTRPHVVLLDIGMPGLSGYEVAQEIRAEPWGGRMILIALTGWGQADDKQKAREAGFDQHLTKPVDPAEVERLLSVLLSEGASDGIVSEKGQRETL